jgi:hypothetical protein
MSLDFLLLHLVVLSAAGVTPAVAVVSIALVVSPHLPYLASCWLFVSLPVFLFNFLPSSSSSRAGFHPFLRSFPSSPSSPPGSPNPPAACLDGSFVVTLFSPSIVPAGVSSDFSS